MKRITDLRTKLLKFVISQVETAIVDFEPPEEEFQEPELIVEESVSEDVSKDVTKTVDDVSEKKEEKIEKVIIQEAIDNGLVKLIDGGFDKKEITINVGDTVTWENARKGQYKIGLLFGNNKCRKVKSGMFNAGESYNYTFTESGTCWVSDGIYTTQSLRIDVLG